MTPIKLKNWLIAIVVLIGLSLIVDYYFIHILFTKKDQAFKTQQAAGTMPEQAPALPEGDETAGTDLPAGKDNFLEEIKRCIPEVAAQGIATPEALTEYFKKSIGVQSENGNEWILNDKSQVTIEQKENVVTHLKYFGHGRTLVCQLKSCRCQ